MKLLFAGAQSKTFHNLLIENGVKNGLVSYFYININKKKENIEEYFKKFKFLMLDSGAFTAFTKNQNINLDNYIEFIKKHHIKYYANLDDIKDEKKSYQNYLEMKSKGLKPIPVFHQFEDYKYLKIYLKECEFIALGGMVGFSSKKLIPFLDKSFSIIKNYWPIKIHGFGLSSPKLMKRYPFYSVDSTSWLAGARYKRIMKFKNGKIKAFNFGRKSLTANQEKLLKFDNPLQYIDNIDNDNKKRYKKRCSKNVKTYLKMENYFTRLWKKRGIDWSKYDE